MGECVSEHDRLYIAACLGREPRGLEAVQVRDSDENPSVIRVASLVDAKPFPTLFWLVDKKLKYKLDTLEANGVIAWLQEKIDASESLLAALREDHRRYCELRAQYMTENIKAELIRLEYYEDLMQRGVGGIANFNRIRCLHTFYAAHLVESNTVGCLLDSEQM